MRNIYQKQSEDKTNLFWLPRVVRWKAKIIPKTLGHEPFSKRLQLGNVYTRKFDEIEHFLTTDALEREKLDYVQELNGMMGLLMGGILTG